MFAKPASRLLAPPPIPLPPLYTLHLNGGHGNDFVLALEHEHIYSYMRTGLLHICCINTHMRNIHMLDNGAASYFMLSRSVCRFCTDEKPGAGCGWLAGFVRSFLKPVLKQLDFIQTSQWATAHGIYQPRMYLLIQFNGGSMIWRLAFITQHISSVHH